MRSANTNSTADTISQHGIRLQPEGRGPGKAAAIASVLMIDGSRWAFALKCLQVLLLL
jgi:hypothetical protein